MTENAGICNVIEVDIEERVESVENNEAGYGNDKTLEEEKEASQNEEEIEDLSENGENEDLPPPTANDLVRQMCTFIIVSLGAIVLGVALLATGITKITMSIIIPAAMIIASSLIFVCLLAMKYNEYSVTKYEETQEQETQEPAVSYQKEDNSETLHNVVIQTSDTSQNDTESNEKVHETDDFK
ncbi:uncharacterized protein LOC144424444 [Styela clava]